MKVTTLVFINQNTTQFINIVHYMIILKIYREKIQFNSILYKKFKLKKLEKLIILLIL